MSGLHFQKAKESTATDESLLTPRQEEDVVLHVADVVQLLRVGRNSVYRLVGRNEIPHRKVGKQIRFSRAAVMRWLASWSLQGAKERH
jgi:excisionase family DNA binding protein